MAGDLDGLSLNLKIMETVFLKMKKNAVFKTDYDFFSGILEHNKDKVFGAINILSTKEHKTRNKNSFYMKDIVSQPASGYAKIAWINGLEIEFDNDLIPNQLLPMSPLSNYPNKIKEYKDLMTKN